MPVRHRFTIDEYHRMGEAGIFHEDSRVELIEGDVFHMCPIGTRHTGGVNRLNALFTRRLGSRVVVSVQNPVILDDFSEPQPDCTILAFRSDYYEGAHPRPSDVLLAIEVADSSVSYDRRIKSSLYARKHVRELWLIDIPGKAIEVYRRPSASGYREHQRLVRGRRIAMAAFPRVFFRVTEILG
ncbi:MAG: Uma2 family endonuclease [Deltaproteobacteria bacterium]|nr:Uma2 family endonuclease [Deltaproteobacteria bacterium]